MPGLALFPAGTTVRDPHHHESATRLEQDWTFAEPEFKLYWMKLCSSDNHYTTAPPLTIHRKSQEGDFEIEPPQKRKEDSVEQKK